MFNRTQNSGSPAKLYVYPRKIVQIVSCVGQPILGSVETYLEVSTPDGFGPSLQDPKLDGGLGDIELESGTKCY